LDIQGSVVYTAVTRVRRGEPERYRAPWPDDPNLMWGGRYPVANHASHQICHDQGDARARVVASVDDARDDPDVLNTWSRLLWVCSEPEFCTWATEQLHAESDPEVRSLWYEWIEDCSDPGLQAVFDREDAPWHASLDWYALQGRLGQIRGAHEGLERALAVGIVEGGYLTGGLAVLGAEDSEAASEMLRRLWEGAPLRSDARREIAMAMHRQSDPELRATFLASCDREPDAPRCLATDPLDDLDTAVRSFEVEPAELLSKHPGHRQAIHQALRACVDDTLVGVEEVWIGERCLRAGLASDRAMAASWVARVDDDQVSWLPLAGELKAYPDGSALLEDLAQWGLIDEGQGDVSEPAAQILEAAGRVWSVNDYGSVVHLARELASRVGGLDDVSFAIWHPSPLITEEELEAPLDDGARLDTDVDSDDDSFGFDPAALEAPVDPRQPRVLLQAFVDGQRVQVLLPEDRSTDLEQVTGLINTLLADREATQRVVLLGHGGLAYMGAPESIQQAIDAGLFGAYVGVTDGGLEY